MKSILFTFLAFSSSLLMGQQYLVDELTQAQQSFFDPLGNRANQDKPKNVMVQIEYIELDHETMTDLLYGPGLLKTSNALRKDLQAMITAKKAKVAESSIVMGRPGETIRIESVKQMIYPTEFDPPEITAGKVNNKGIEVKEAAVGPTPTAFEERPVGLIFEAEPRIGEGPDSNIISLDFNTGWVSYEGNIDWATWKDKRGEANVSLVQFYKLEMKTGVTLKHGDYCFLGAFSPKNEKGFANHDKKLMLFVRSVIKIAGQ